MLGKDRTGVFVALVLLALGVPMNSVVEDYSATETQMDRQTRLRAIFVAGADPHFAEAPAVEMRQAIDRVSASHGSIDKYFDEIGFTKAHRERLRDNLLH